MQYTANMGVERDYATTLSRAQEVWEAERAAAEAARAEADSKRQRVVVTALDAGISVGEIARAMGLSPARIYQIRDGRR